MTQARKKTNYHHGNLKTALVDTALKALENDGLDHISLRKLARTLNVSQTAVYSHFADKSALIAAIAEQGFIRQGAALHMAARDIRDPYERVLTLGTAYIKFATENRPLFQIMYSREIQDIQEHPGVSFAAGKVYALFAASWSRFKPDHSAQTAAVWSMIHGHALLMMDPKFGPAIARGRNAQALIQDALKPFTIK